MMSLIHLNLIQIVLKNWKTKRWRPYITLLASQSALGLALHTFILVLLLVALADLSTFIPVFNIKPYHSMLNSFDSQEHS